MLTSDLDLFYDQIFPKYQEMLGRNDSICSPFRFPGAEFWGVGLGLEILSVVM